MSLTNNMKRAILLDAIDDVANLQCCYSCVAILNEVVRMASRNCEDTDDAERHGDALAEEYKAFVLQAQGALPSWWGKPSYDHYKERCDALTAFRNSIPEDA